MTYPSVTTAQILIVDDSVSNRMALSAILRKQGYDIIEAEGGEGAITQAQQCAPDLIILDIRMPGMDGFTACEHLKTDPGTAAIPVMFISALEEVEDTVKAFAVGGCDYIHKPFQVAEVLARVNAQVSLRQQQQQLQSWADQLEERVHQRTYELEQANLDLTREIMQRQQAQEQLERIALYDSLTRLPNRLHLLQELERRLRRSLQVASPPFLLLLMDCDRFKTINDSLGHREGDYLLQLIGARLQTHRSANMFLARLGEDEFAVVADIGVELPRVDAMDCYRELQTVNLLPRESHVLCAQPSIVHEWGTRLVNWLRSQMQLPFQLAEKEVFVDVCTGLTSSERYQDAESLLQDADTALYRAKEQGPDCHRLFESKMYVGAISRLDLETDLRRAVPNGELELAYQPIIALGTGQLAGFEALVRWNHPVSTISPARFIPVAEETGEIEAIGEWSMEEACRQLHQWQRRYPEAQRLHVGVNVSARQFRHSALLKAVDRILATYPLAEGSLKVELTESVLMDNASAGWTLLGELRSRQIQVCLDDFGTGYSSMSYLQQLPLSTLKIDRSFVMAMVAEEGNPAIVQAIVTLAHSLGLEVIAEGLESVEQMRTLAGMGCEFGQGYYFAKPLSAADAEELLARSPRWLAHISA